MGLYVVIDHGLALQCSCIIRTSNTSLPEVFYVKIKRRFVPDIRTQLGRETILSSIFMIESGEKWGKITSFIRNGADAEHLNILSYDIRMYVNNLWSRKRRSEASKEYPSMIDSRHEVVLVGSPETGTSTLWRDVITRFVLLFGSIKRISQLNYLFILVKTQNISHQ